MRIIIINRTDKTQKIRKSNGDIVAINAYSPYILETNFNPEINFWKSCTDTRFIVSDRIQDLNKLVANLPKTIVDKQKQIIKESKAADEINSKNIQEPVIKAEDSTNINNTDNNEVVIDKQDEKPVSINNSTTNDTISILDNAYKSVDTQFETDLNELSVKNLRILAEKNGITLPKYGKKSEIIDLIKENISK